MSKKVLYLECFSGISGDMTVGALLDLGADPEVLKQSLDLLHVEGYEIKIGRSSKCGIDACDFDVLIPDQPEYDEGHMHHHHDEDEHEHHHHHDDEDHSHCDHEHGHCCHHHHHGDDDEEYGICTFVYHSRRPFNQEKLQEFVNNWPKGVVRAKGILWFSDKDKRDYLYVFEQAGVQITATENGKWLAAFPKSEQKKYFKEYPDIEEHWDEKYGDRETKLVFIGQHMDKQNIIERLDNCLDD